MVAERQIQGAGTSEAEWLKCAALTDLPEVSIENLLPKGTRLVVCAPHPDDEILPCGGLLAAAHAAGRAIKILAITDGEGSHGPRSRTTPEMLRKLRPEETKESLRRLEVVAEIQRLHLPDGGLARAEAALFSAFATEFLPNDMVLIPWQWDGHPDHEAVARSAHQAAQDAGAEIIETPIWGWHWSTPSAPESTSMPWERGCKLLLDRSQQLRKQHAIGAFTSQVSGGEDPLPILTATTLERFSRPWEVYFR